MTNQSPVKQSATANSATSSTRSSVTTKSRSRLSGMRDRINSLSVPKPIAFSLVALLLMGASWSVYSSLPQSVKKPKIGTFQMDTPDNAWMRDKIRETGGDFTRLPVADREKANKISRSLIGMSADVLFKSPDAVAPLDPNKYQQARTDAWLAQQKR